MRLPWSLDFLIYFWFSNDHPFASTFNFQQHSIDLCPTDVTMVMTYWSDCHAIPSRILFVCDCRGHWTFWFTSNFPMTTHFHQLSISDSISLNSFLSIWTLWSYTIVIIVPLQLTLDLYINHSLFIPCLSRDLDFWCILSAIDYCLHYGMNFIPML